MCVHRTGDNQLNIVIHPLGNPLPLPEIKETCWKPGQTQKKKLGNFDTAKGIVTAWYLLTVGRTFELISSPRPSGTQINCGKFQDSSIYLKFPEVHTFIQQQTEPSELVLRPLDLIKFTRDSKHTKDFFDLLRDGDYFTTLSHGYKSALFIFTSEYICHALFYVSCCLLAPLNKGIKVPSAKHVKCSWK